MATWIGTMPNGDSIYDNGDGTFSYGSDSRGWQTSRSNPNAGGIGPGTGGSGTITSYAPPNQSDPGRYSTDYTGSYDEWVHRTARVMAENYMRGQAEWQNFSGGAGIGQPNGADFGSGANGQTGFISTQTYDYFVRYLETYGATDPYVISTYGAPPTARATYGANPNEPGIMQREHQDWQSRENAADRDWQSRENQADRDFQAGENAADRAVERERIAVQREAIQNDWNIAVMDDATRRYIAEGDWGTQRYIAELQEAGALERLKLELGQRDEELAQRAIEEKNRHHENMIGLTLEVAKYDAQLAAEPRNWLAYAAWLGERDVVVNGLTLAMASDMVPDDQAQAALATNAATIPGGQVALAEYTYSQTGLATGQSGGSATPAAGQPQTAMGPMKNTGATTATGPQAQAGAQTSPYTVGGVDLASRDYSAIARELLGMNALGPTGQPSAEDLQATYDATRGKSPGFQAWKGPTQNALGVNVNAMGHKQDYRKFADLMPSMQDMNLAAVSSVGKWVPDFMKEMERARPKGGATGTASYG